MNTRRSWKEGFCDSILDRECKSPYKDFIHSQSYLQGYLAGQKQKGIRYDSTGTKETQVNA